MMCIFIYYTISMAFAQDIFWEDMSLFLLFLRISRLLPAPSVPLCSYGFLVFFLTMFGNMVFQTYLVASGAGTLREAIKLLWIFRVPFGWAYSAGTVADWIAQYSFGFYSIMLTSTIIGLVVMALFKPRTWCTFCPMGTMAQMICKLEAKQKL